jgi:AcrR family transcriptional regulator
MKDSKRLRAIAPTSVERSAHIAIHAPGEHAKRRRRAPDIAESEILEAAERLLRRVPFRKLTIGGLMATTGLRRPSFYQYFDDLYQVLARLAQRHVKIVSQYTQRYAERILNMSDVAIASQESAAIRRGQWLELCKAYRKNRHFHRLLVRSSALDPEVGRIYRSYVGEMAQQIADLIRQLQGRGIATSLDPDETGLALHLMTESYMFEKLDGPASEVEKVARTMERIWEKVVYGELPGFVSVSKDKAAGA